MTRLPRRLAPLAPPPLDAAELEERAGRLVEAVLAGVIHCDVVVPRTTVAGKLRLLTRAETAEVKADTRRCLAERYGLTAQGPGVLEGHEEYREERNLRILAAAVRDPANPARPLATLEEWSECDDGQLAALWERYQDLEAELDPLTHGEPTEEEVAAILAAAKKGDRELLTSFGSRKLARFAITSVSAPTT